MEPEEGRVPGSLRVQGTLVGCGDPFCRGRPSLIGWELSPDPKSVRRTPTHLVLSGGEGGPSRSRRDFLWSLRSSTLGHRQWTKSDLTGSLSGSFRFLSVSSVSSTIVSVPVLGPEGMRDRSPEGDWDHCHHLVDVKLLTSPPTPLRSSTLVLTPRRPKVF